MRWCVSSLSPEEREALLGVEELPAATVGAELVVLVASRQ